MSQAATMELNNETDIYCLGCLCTPNEYKINDYKIKYAHFKAIFVTDSIKLCTLCSQKAHQAELFIENVQNIQNHLLLQNCVGDIISATIKEIRSQIQAPINLSQTSIQTDKLTAIGSDDTLDGSFTYFRNDPKRKKMVKDINCKKSISKDIKIEFKEEWDHSDDALVIDDDFQDPYVKEEDEFPLKELLKEEHIEGIEVMSLRTRNLRKKVVKKKSTKKKISPNKIAMTEKLPRARKDEGIETVFITLEQCMEERKQQAMDKRYLNLMYKCENCLKGYAYKASYEMHMQRHAETSGDYECNICKLRMESEDKLASHQRYHSIRYRCSSCGLQRVCRMSVKEHIAVQHRPTARPHVCPHCAKTFKRLVSFKKHVRYTHSGAGRVTCAYCHKTYANTTVLKSHMMDMHSTEVSSAGRSEARPYKCTECGAAFKCPSHLRNHGSKHTTARNYYCVECDKAFKSEAVLKQHLKTAQPHVNYSELPIPCEHCERRFANRRDLERHTNRIHLHIKPYQCDKCERAYITKWALTDHRRRAHEGYRMPLRFPCKMCDKIFDRNTILKVHMRTHTGERPYQCDKCPAQFSQSSVLATHNKLIHLKLTRDGRPKVSMK